MKRNVFYLLAVDTLPAVLPTRTVFCLSGFGCLRSVALSTSLYIVIVLHVSCPLSEHIPRTIFYVPKIRSDAR